MNIKEKVERGFVHCVIIIEIAGRPPEHISEAMRFVLNGLAKEKGIEIIKTKVHKPKKIPKAKNLFSTFSETEFLIEKFSRLLEIVLDYMPSSVEIIGPLCVKLDINESNNIVNDLATKLHQYDAAKKAISLERDILRKKLEELGK